MYIYEEFIEDSDPIKDMKIGKSRWMNDVLQYFINEIFGNESYADIFFEISHDKLEELYQKEVSVSDAANMCFDDIKLYREWENEVGRTETRSDPTDDLKANCRHFQDAGGKDSVDELTRYLINRYPNFDPGYLKDLADTWCGVYGEEELDESYIMKPLFEECGCNKKRNLPPIPNEPSPIINEPPEPPPPPLVNEGCNCGKKKIRSLLSSINKQRPRPTTKPSLRPRPNRPKLQEKFVEDSDPIHDLGIGVEQKDLMRINDIIRKARGYRWEERKLAETMCKLITDKNKAFRRYLAAKSVRGSDWDVTKMFLHRAKQLGHESALRIIENLNKKYNMKKIYENYGKHDVKTISKIAVKNMDKWVHHQDGEYFTNEIEFMIKKEQSIEEIKEFMYDFLDTHIMTFFNAFSKYNNVQKIFLEDNKDEIIDNIIEELIGRPPEEESDVEQIIKRSKEKQNVPNDYSKMSQYDLKKEVDKALDAKDFDTLRKIQSYLKEGFLKYHVVEFLNENKDDEYIIPKLR